MKHKQNRPDNFRGRAYIVHTEFPQKKRKGVVRDLEYVLEEAQGLVRALALEVVGLKTFNISKIQPGLFLGRGQCDTVLQEIEKIKPDVVIFNYNLSPVQQRNLERAWNIKVVDRTGLILEIFGARAQTKEGRLQVELAAMEYKKSRLVKAWSHLERQRGGGGFTGGPGETQKELDRRMIAERILKLKRDLEDVRRTRALSRKNRQKVPFPIISLVGYTNAGKSTLFNQLTDAGVFAEDLPFATLDPTMRRINLPSGQPVIFADTVGFISDLPTHLVESFRATLEQITASDVIIHVIDVSRPDYKAQTQDVKDILKDLEIQYETDSRILEAWNKSDALTTDERQEFSRQEKHKPEAILISALKGNGIDDLLKSVSRLLNKDREHFTFLVPETDGKAIAWLYRHGAVISRSDKKEKAYIEVLLNLPDVGKIYSHYGYKPVKTNS